MTNDDLPEPLARFIRERRVRFTVSLEKVIRENTAIPVGFDVRLLAWHGHDPHELAGCAVCGALERQLQQVAALSLRGEDHPTEVEFLPEYAVLYESRDAPGTDDVALDVWLLRRGQDDQPVGKVEERYLQHVRRRLKELGLREC